MSMNSAERKSRVRMFVQKWIKQPGDEDSQSQLFWFDFMRDVCGIDDTNYLKFEKPVKLRESDGKVHTRKIDVYVPLVRVIIEMKSSDIDLAKKCRQSGGDMLTPYEQAKRYSDNIPRSQQGRYIITCNFREFRIYDLNDELPEDQPVIIRLDELVDKYQTFTGIFSYSRREDDIVVEEQISTKAGELVGQLYDELKNIYPDAGKDKNMSNLILKSLNILCVRFVFLFYAEDAGLFGTDEKLFQELVSSTPAEFLTAKFKTLFRVLNMKNDDALRSFESAEMQAFPYVNGGLFAEENILIPQMTEAVREFIAHEAAEFDWSPISPTIFGAMFESTISAKMRRSGGMHYTSVENIHKVIDPLFLDDLTHEVESLEDERSHLERIRKHGLTKNDTDNLLKKVKAFQKKLAEIKILDPACGSGNFLTESYLSLRRLENRALKVAQGGQLSIGFEDVENPIKVHISQFYGIEISGFACDVARTALWIAEAQMYDETKSIVLGMKDDFLPLTSNHNIHKENALKIDWSTVVNKEKLTYIVGNPPFLGFTYMDRDQKKDMASLFGKVKNLDYVTAWFKKASDFIENSKIICSFVATNSISQGETVARLWKFLKIEIIFAYKDFRWSNEASNQAHVYVIILGFKSENCFWNKQKYIYSNKKRIAASNINGYLSDAPNIIVESRNKPLCNVPRMIYGNKPADGGNLLLSDEEKNILVQKEPQSKKFIKPLLGAKEFLHNETRWCLWLKGAQLSEIKKCPLIMQRVQKCKEKRESSKAPGIRKFALTPTLFAQITQPEDENFIIIPRVSSQTREYIPMAFMEAGIIVTDSVQIIPNATLYDFGILTSNVHMAWMRTVAGRLKSDYRYSKDIVYNNFIWPSLLPNQKAQIEITAREVINARNNHAGESYADLYNPLLMPADLRRAHKDNDLAVMNAYGFSANMSEADIVAELMKLYQEKTK